MPPTNPPIANTAINTIASAGFTDGLLLGALAHIRKRGLALTERQRQSGDERREKGAKNLRHRTLPKVNRASHAIQASSGEDSMQYGVRSDNTSQHVFPLLYTAPRSAFKHAASRPRRALIMREPLGLVAANTCVIYCARLARHCRRE